LIRVVKYTAEKQTDWDTFVAQSAAPSLLFYRNYMDYHSDRFSDYSLLIYQKDELIALFPANYNLDTIFSHNGLTYGGLILNPSLKTQTITEVFIAVFNYYKADNFKKILYKAVPNYLYRTNSNETETYLLYLLGAKLYDVELNTLVSLRDKPVFQVRRMRGVQKAVKHGFKIKKTNNFEVFWQILTQNLQKKYGILPVHSLDEIMLLKKYFFQQIELFVVVAPSGEIVAGTVLFLHPTTVHAQYIAASEEGKKYAALDLLFFKLFNRYKRVKKYFSLGVSSRRGEQAFNKGLLDWKEGWGNATAAHCKYEISLEVSIPNVQHLFY
jgi:hypothetical protein